LSLVYWGRLPFLSRNGSVNVGGYITESTIIDEVDEKLGIKETVADWVK